jgi:murein DD-endopeptidase MepM/ murein hydrolase activator NlpD
VLQERTRGRIGVASIALLLVVPVWEAAAGEPPGAELAERLTRQPAETILLTSVEDFDPDGGIATIDPGGERPEVVSYASVDPDASALTGVGRDEPRRHDAGTFVAPAEPEPDPSPTPEESPSPEPSPKDSPKPEPKDSPSPSPSGGPSASPAGGERDGKPPGCGDCGAPEVFWAGPSDPNSYSTSILSGVFSEMLAAGVTADRARTLAFSPFIVGGDAEWSDTWGAPRRGPGPQLRHHEGQDVFCRAGTPLLAAAPGRVDYDSGGLGGRVARLHLDEGGYLYYAHVSEFGDATSGSRVRTGDVVGYCGNSGNARGSAPHVHFGWYDASGVARDPMELLVGWLQEAERRAEKRLRSLKGKAAPTAAGARTRHLFGDGLVPERSSLIGPISVDESPTEEFMETLGLPSS